MNNETLAKAVLMSMIFLISIALITHPLFKKYKNYSNVSTNISESTNLSENMTSNKKYNIKAYMIEVPKYFATTIIKKYNTPKSYKKDNTYYHVVLLSGNGDPAISYYLVFNETTKCLRLEVNSEPTTRTITNYDIMIVVKAPYSCFKYVDMNSKKEITSKVIEKECMTDEECIHRPAYCHKKAMPCMPYYTLNKIEASTLLNLRKDIACTMECRSCIECKCIDGVCKSLQIKEGCC